MIGVEKKRENYFYWHCFSRSGSTTPERIAKGDASPEKLTRCQEHPQTQCPVCLNTSEPVRSQHVSINLGSPLAACRRHHKGHISPGWLDTVIISGRAMSQSQSSDILLWPRVLTTVIEMLDPLPVCNALRGSKGDQSTAGLRENGRLDQFWPTQR